MKLRTLVITLIAVTIFVFIGVYLSESATNHLLGLGRSPQLVSLTPMQGGVLRIQILGKQWTADAHVLWSSALAMITQAQEAVRQRIAQMIAR